jgi:hypothetical protein
MRHVLLWLAIGSAVILVVFWNEGEECRPDDEYDWCEQEREDRQF